MKQFKLYLLLFSFVLSGFISKAQLATCEVPRTNATKDITQNSAKISWYKTAAVKYTVAYGTTTAGLMYITTQDTVVNLNQLLPNTVYFWKVQAYCPLTGTNSFIESGYSTPLYFKTLSPPNSCENPKIAKTKEIKPNSALLTWSKVQGACSYQYYITPYTGKLYSTTDTSALVTDLKPGTGYLWMVQTVCCNGNTSANYTQQQFSTPQPPLCKPPDNFHSFNITANSATLGWNVPEGTCYFKVKYYALNSPNNPIIITVTDSLINISNLLPNTEYKWQVASICCNSNDSLISNWSPLQNFKTKPQPSCPAPEKYFVKDITATSASLEWSPVQGACSYNLIYYTSNNNYKTISLNTNSYLLKGLEANTDVFWKINVVCCDGYQGQNGPVQVFKTLINPDKCNPPLHPETKNITQNSATLKWSAVRNSCGYIVAVYNATINSDYKIIQTKDTAIVINGLIPFTYYSWQVKTICCNNSQSEYTPKLSFKTLAPTTIPCNVPQNLKIADLLPHSVILKWDAVAGACGYHVSIYNNNQSYAKIIPVKTNSIKLDSLLSGTKYHWSVRTVCCDPTNPNYNYSNYAPYQMFETPIPPLPVCQTPSNPKSFDITQTEAKLSWNKTTYGCLYTIVYYPANSYTNYKVVQTQDTTITLKNLLPNTTYLWKIKAICCVPGSNIKTESEFSPVFTFTTLPAQNYICKAPTELAAGNITQTSAVLSWNSSGNTNIYLVAYWPAGSSAAPVYVKTQDTTITLNNLKPGTIYEWKVKAYCIFTNTSAEIVSDWSKIEKFETLKFVTNCKPPVNLHVFNITPYSATLGWSMFNPNFNNYFVIEYMIKNSITPAFITITTKDSSVTIKNLIPATEYVWRIKTVCCYNTNISCVSSEFSPWQTFKTLPYINDCKTPENPVSFNITEKSATLAWHKVEGACYYIVNYTPAITMQPGFLVINSKDTSVTINNLIVNMDYDWKVKTICCSSAGTYNESDFTALQHFKTLEQPQANCNVPVELKTEKITATSALLTWKAPKNACYFLIEYHAVNSNTEEYKFIKTNNQFAELNGLKPESYYVWKVKSYCCSPNGSIIGESLFSNPTSFKTLKGEEIKCLPPQNPLTTQIMHNSVILRWDSVRNSCLYVVEVSQNDSTGSFMKIFRTTTNYIKIDGLKPSEIYKWRVKTYCCNINLTSVFTPFISFKTMDEPVVKCNPPLGLFTSDITESSAKLNWKPENNALAYLVYLWTDSVHFRYWITKNINEVINNLKPDTKYSWKLKAICFSTASSNPVYSDFSEIQTFKTKPLPQIVCIAPTQLEASEITAHKALIEWSAVNNAKGYLVIYKAVNDSFNLKYIFSRYNKLSLTGLKANTYYTWKVKSVCNPDFNKYLDSDFSSISYFKTTVDTIIPKCTTPQNLVVNNITDSLAHLKWDVVPNASLYAILYTESNTGTIKYKLAKSTPFVLTGLKPLTKYTCKVAAICGENNNYVFSRFSDTISFTTNIKVDKKFNNSVIAKNTEISIYPNPASSEIQVNISNAAENINLKIFNFAGQEVYNQNINTVSNYYSGKVNLSDYPKGIYFVKAINNSKIITKKLIIH